MAQELRSQVSACPAKPWRSRGLRSPPSAFTLIELLVVVTIIGILVSIILGVSGYSTRKADRARAIADLEKIKNGLEEYRMAYGTYPINDPATNNSIIWVAELWVKPQTVGENKRPFLTAKFLTNSANAAAYLDPWNNDYRYLHRSLSPYADHNNMKFGYDLWSMGPDGATDADDIRNWAGDF